MDSDNSTSSRSEEREDDRGGILQRIEEKLDSLINRSKDDWRERGWVPEDSPFAYYSPGDPSPRFLGGPRADAPGWDPGIAGPRFDRINLGAVGTHAVDPVSSFDGAQRPLTSAHSSAREYYLFMRALGRPDSEGTHYADYRGRKIDELDREYAQYHREQQARFDQDFDAWRQRRAGPPKPVDEPIRSETSADDGKIR